MGVDHVNHLYTAAMCFKLSRPPATKRLGKEACGCFIEWWCGTVQWWLGGALCMQLGHNPLLHHGHGQLFVLFVAVRHNCTAACSPVHFACAVSCLEFVPFVCL